MFDHVGVVFRDLARAGAVLKYFDGNNIEAGVYAAAPEGSAHA